VVAVTSAAAELAQVEAAEVVFGAGQQVTVRPPARRRRRLYWRRVCERIPWPVAVVIAAIFLFGWFAAMTGISQLTGGTPERHGGHYFSDKPPA
jgi:di/tricarboxylate transporter